MEINFHIDYDLPSRSIYAETERDIRCRSPYIRTHSMAHLSFDLMDMGYDIYLCYNFRKIKIEPHMEVPGFGEVKRGHNLLKMFRAGVFNELLGIDDSMDPNNPLEWKCETIECQKVKRNNEKNYDKEFEQR